MRCGTCDTVLIGPYCHGCGQQRIDQPLTTRELVSEFARRVLRFDRAFAMTILRSLRAPGTLTIDYLAGRRRGIVDPIVYFIGTVFVQFVLASLAHLLTPLLRLPAMVDRLGAVGRLVALKIAVLLIAAGAWRLLARSRHSTAELAVFAIYSFGTLGLLWALLPLLELVFRVPISSHRPETVIVVLVIAFVYLTHGIRNFGELSVWGAAWRAAFALGLANGLMVALIGIGRSIDFIAPLFGA